MARAESTKLRMNIVLYAKTTPSAWNGAENRDRSGLMVWYVRSTPTGQYSRNV